MKTTLRILGVLVLFCVALVCARNLIIHKTLGSAVRRMTGFDLTFDSVNVGIFRRTIEITGLKLFNPPDFPDREAIIVRRVYIRYSLGLLVRDEIHLPEVVIDIPKIVVVRKADGETNLGRLGKVAKPVGKPAKPEPAPTPAPGPESPPEKSKPPRPLLIDHLTLRLGTAQYIAYSKKNGERQSRTFEMNVDRTYEHVTDLNAIALKLSGEIVAQALLRTVTKVTEKMKKNGDMNKIEKLANDFGNMFKKTKSTK